MKESEVTQSCPTLCDPMDCSLPGFSVHGIFQARVLEWVAISLKGNAKECSNYHTIPLISHSNNMMLKILQARLQYTWTKNFQMYKLDLEKAEEPEIKLPTSTGSQKKTREFQNKSTSASLTMLAFDCMNHNKCGKFLKIWKYQTTLPVVWETYMWVKKRQLELDMEVTSSQLVMEYNKAVYCHPPLSMGFSK